MARTSNRRRFNLAARNLNLPPVRSTFVRAPRHPGCVAKDLRDAIRGRAGWKLTGEEEATYRRDRGRVRRNHSPRARTSWHAVVLDEGQAVLSLPAYSPAEAVEWVERHTD